jgi:hypothetical protein
MRASGRSSSAREGRSISGDGGPARWGGDADVETVIASVIIIIPRGDEGEEEDADKEAEGEREEVEKGGGSVAMGDTPWEDDDEAKSRGRGQRPSMPVVAEQELSKDSMEEALDETDPMSVSLASAVECW